MPRELKNVQVTHVSFVDKAANKKKFFLTKSADKPNFEKQVKAVTKADDPQKLVYGVVYEPEVKDAHDDFMTAREIEKAAHGFMESYQNIDKQHDFETEAGKVVESYIAPADIEIGKTTITKGTWVLVTKATDEMWESIQKGEFTGYSLAGTAEVEEVEKATQAIFDKNKVVRNLNTALDAFRSATWRIVDDYQLSDDEKVLQVQSEVTELTNLIGSTQITKSQEKQGLIDTIKSFFSTKKQESEGEEMKKEEMLEVLKDAFAPIDARLTELEKATGKGKEDEKDKEKKKDEEETDSTVQTMKAAVAEAMAPISERLEKLEKSRQSNVVEQSYSIETEVKKQAVPSYVDAVFGNK
ncbi:DNA methyltransferase [Vagococcus penaei]|uniref:XkdF-like putative serine protease domain-containing protein n=1 Tax=Vagococcus penaei TaxID=633807 RepID=UPI000F89BFBE|nr:XkdF-like putative serine protease domain-containing protein [Vagococcus penaei]RSU01416.1 DNA methyltransferase [Vagococcus penaei]